MDGDALPAHDAEEEGLLLLGRVSGSVEAAQQDQNGVAAVRQRSVLYIEDGAALSRAATPANSSVTVSACNEQV